LPPGTLTANLVGGYLVGLAIAVFTQWPQLAPEWRLFVITGFLGGLTTFSTFSAEVVIALQQGRLGWALATIAVHLCGSLALTLAGLATPALFVR
jgi:CrcB protein